MNCSQRALYIVILLLMLLVMQACHWFDRSFESRWDQTPQRVWVGADYWANRLQDWRIHEGRLECVNNTRPMRTVHVLTRHLNSKDRAFSMSLQTGTLSESARRTDAWAGFLVGAGSLEDDYRMRALIHQAHGSNGGLIAGINGKGEITVIDNENSRKTLHLERDRRYNPPGIPESGINLHLLALPSDKAYRLTLWARNHRTGETIDSAYIDGISGKRLQGNLALTAHIEDTSHKASFWFKKWKIEGAKIQKSNDRQFGPVLAAHYTINQGTLHMTAQMPPLSKDHLKKVKLEIREKGTDQWQEAGPAGINTPGWMAAFRIKNWNSQKTWDYRLSYALKESAEPLYLKGTIQKEPDKKKLVLAGMNNIKNTPRPLDETYPFTGDSIWFPHPRFIENIRRHQPDMLAYTGNQVYRNLPTTVRSDTSDEVYLDYLYKWYLFCWAHGDLTRNTPSIILPGPGDLYRKPLHVPDTAEFRQTALSSHHMPASFINMVQNSQTGHLPLPHDPTPNDQGIPAFYTDLQYGGLDLAIIETNKFPGETTSQASKEQNTPLAEELILGQRQLRFLKKWIEKWEGAHIKAVISHSSLTGDGFQSPLPEKEKPSGITRSLDEDKDDHPEPEWRKALKIIRKAQALSITSGKPSAYALHYGIHRKGDASYEFGFPPLSPPSAKIKKDVPSRHPTYQTTNSQHTQFRYRTPLSDLRKEERDSSKQLPGEKQFPATGYGIVHFDITHQKIELSVWPGRADREKREPYRGWPFTLRVEDNYLQKPAGYLPEIITKGLSHKPIYKLYHDNDTELIYARRAKDSLFRPPVYDESVFTLLVGSPEENRMDTLRNLVPVKMKKQIILDFRQR